MLKIEIVGLERTQRELDPKIFKKATLSALNKTGKQALTAADKAMRQIYTLKKKDITKALKFKKANYSTMTAYIVSKGTKFPVIAFQAKQTKKGVTVKIKRAGGKKLIRHAFKATMKSGHTGVYQRAGKSRLPLKPELRTISVPQTLTSEKILDVINKAIDDNLQKNFNSAVLYYMNKVKK